MGQLGFFDADAFGSLVSEGWSARSHRSSRAVGALSRRNRGVVLTPDELEKSSAAGSRLMPS